MNGESSLRRYSTLFYLLFKWYVPLCFTWDVFVYGYDISIVDRRVHVCACTCLCAFVYVCVAKPYYYFIICIYYDDKISFGSKNMVKTLYVFISYENNNNNNNEKTQTIIIIIISHHTAQHETNKWWKRTIEIRMNICTYMFLFWSGKLTISEMRDSLWVTFAVPDGDTRWCHFLLKWSFRCVLPV